MAFKNCGKNLWLSSLKAFFRFPAKKKKLNSASGRVAVQSMSEVLCNLRSYFAPHKSASGKLPCKT
jgi:hypothetical protein